MDVVLNYEELSSADRAQIEDIVTRKTGYSVSQLIISKMQTTRKLKRFLFAKTRDVCYNYRINRYKLFYILLRDFPCVFYAHGRCFSMSCRQKEVSMGKEKDTKINHTVYNIEDVGQVQIADEVVAVIAGLAATETDGVAKMSRNITNEIVIKLGMKKLSKGVKLQYRNTGRCYSESCTELWCEHLKTSQEVQDKVKSAIETMTGLTVF